MDFSGLSVEHPQQCWILCCHCGTSIQPNSANMCISCLKSRVDITEGISKQIAIQHCRSCERYFQPPSQWIVCQPESRELLSLCLKRLNIGARVSSSGARLVDAGFLWTEPHSRRLKLKITIQKEVFASTILQQTFPIEIVICNQQCPKCTKVMAKNTWNTNVQVRQKVSHQRTFLYLEQLILKHKAHAESINIKKVHQGLDFYFSSRTHALKFVEFLDSVVPIKNKSSEQLLSKDVHSGSSSYKFTFAIDILPVCKGDMICLPSVMARKAGIKASPLVLITKVGRSLVSMLDPATARSIDLPVHEFWHHLKRIKPLFSYSDLKSFIVLDSTPLYHLQGNSTHLLADVEIGKESDGFSNTLIIRTHLGRLLRPGDHVLGYDLSTANANNEDYANIEDSLPQSIYLVKKATTSSSKKKRRSWKLKHLKSEEGNDEVDETSSVISMNVVSSSSSKKQPKKPKRVSREEQEDEDEEIFMQEIEEDPEFRTQFDLYKSRSYSQFEYLEEEDEAEMNLINVADLLDDLSIASEDEVEAC